MSHTQRQSRNATWSQMLQGCVRSITEPGIKFPKNQSLLGIDSDLVVKAAFNYDRQWHKMPLSSSGYFFACFKLELKQKLWRRYHMLMSHLMLYVQESDVSQLRMRSEQPLQPGVT